MEQIPATCKLLSHGSSDGGSDKTGGNGEGENVTAPWRFRTNEPGIWLVKSDSRKGYPATLT
jgi:hypothetical protein